MSYRIRNKKGEIVATLPNGSVLNPGELSFEGEAFDITLHGRGRLEWGSNVNENFIYLLENFASNTPPANPHPGQLWFDSNETLIGSSPAEGALKFYNSHEQWITLLDTVIGASILPYVKKAGDTMTGSLLMKNGSASSPGYSFSSDPDTGFYSTAGGINWCNEGEYRGTLGNNVTAYGNYYSQTGGYFAQDGLVGTPTFSFVNDTNTGIYRISENQLGITTGGVLRLTVSTNAITSELPIRGPTGSASAPTYSFSSDTDTGFYNNTAGEINWCDEGVYRGTLGDNVTAYGDYYSQTGGYFAQDGLVNAPTFSFDNDTNTGMYLSGTDQLSFSTVGTRRLTIESNGTLNVAGTSNYETLVTHDDDIPNKKYVDNAASGAVFTHPDPHLLSFGSASIPTYSFNGDANTGMYRAGSDHVGLSGRMTITSSTSPAVLSLVSTTTDTTRGSYIEFHSAAGSGGSNPSGRTGVIGFFDPFPSAPGGQDNMVFLIERNEGNQSWHFRGSVSSDLDNPHSTDFALISMHTSQSFAVGGPDHNLIPTNVDAPAFAIEANGFDLVLGKHNQVTRGNSGRSRALVKWTGNQLILNYLGDFGGGTQIDTHLNVAGRIELNQPKSDGVFNYNYAHIDFHRGNTPYTNYDSRIIHAKDDPYMRFDVNTTGGGFVFGSHTTGSYAYFDTNANLNMWGAYNNSGGGGIIYHLGTHVGGHYAARQDHVIVTAGQAGHGAWLGGLWGYTNYWIVSAGLWWNFGGGSRDGIDSFFCYPSSYITGSGGSIQVICYTTNGPTFTGNANYLRISVRS